MPSALITEPSDAVLPQSEYTSWTAWLQEF
jgi:hypothetical protein